MNEFPPCEPASLEQIRSIRSHALQRLSELVRQPKPSYSVDGQSVSWNEYFSQLQKTVDWCDAATNRLSPPIVVSRGRSL